MTARWLTKALGGRWYGSYGMARCPVHNDDNPSLSITERNGKLLVHCFAGCDQQAVWTALRGRQLLPDLHTEMRHTHEKWAHKQRLDWLAKKGIDPEAQARTDRARRIWEESGPTNGTPVDRYLKGRGLSLDVPTTIRYHPGLRHGPTLFILPCMVAAVTIWPDNQIVAIHRTFLEPDGRKAAISQNKLMLGSCRGGAARLAPCRDSLMVGEGIETCLTAMQATGEPAWAALSTSGLCALVLPNHVQYVTILADGDEAGEMAARKSAWRWIQQGRHVRIARPPQGLDFNDLLISRIPQSKEGGE